MHCIFLNHCFRGKMSALHYSHSSSLSFSSYITSHRENLNQILYKNTDLGLQNAKPSVNFWFSTQRRAQLKPRIDRFNFWLLHIKNNNWGTKLWKMVNALNNTTTESSPPVISQREIHFGTAESLNLLLLAYLFSKQQRCQMICTRSAFYI